MSFTACLCAWLAVTVGAEEQAPAKKVYGRYEGRIERIDPVERTFALHSGEAVHTVIFNQAAVRYLRPGSLEEISPEGPCMLWGRAESGNAAFHADRLIIPRPPPLIGDGRMLSNEASGHVEREGDGWILRYDGRSVPLTFADPPEIHVTSKAEGNALRSGQTVQITGFTLGEDPRVHAVYLDIVVEDEGDERRARALQLDPAGAMPDLLQLVTAYADAMIEHGRDRYGAEHTPLFAATIDLRTMRMPEPDHRAVASVYQLFRTSANYATAANPHWNVNLYQVLDALTTLTGEERYRRAVDDEIGYFFRHAQSPETDLMAWGEHIGWDLLEEKLSYALWRETKVVDIHEFFRPWIYWERTSALAGDAAHRFALGLWNNQIQNQETCGYSRHAHYIKRGPSSGAEFPRHGGFYIATWAGLYAHTGDKELLRAIAALVNAFEGWRNPKTGIIPADTSNPRLCWPPSNLSLAIDLWDGAAKVPEELGRKMKATAEKIDANFLAMPHELGPEGRGFGTSVDTDRNAIDPVLPPGDETAAARLYPGGRNWPYSTRWATGYGGAGQSDAKLAMLCLERYRQNGVEGFRTLALQAADRYFGSEPELGMQPIEGTDRKRFVHMTPEMVAAPIGLMVEAYRLTDDHRYLARARELAEHGYRRLFHANRPLPQSSHHPDMHYYAGVSLADTLLMQYLNLWLAEHRPDAGIAFRWTDR